MQHEYYRVLGIDSNASFETIRDAYRQRAMKCHPDRGGSHEQMVLINEAWEILSDPERRRRYDAVRLDSANLSVQAAAAADAQQAHQQAEQYPQRWAEFEAWLDNVTADLTTRAKYGGRRMSDWSVFSFFWFPTAGDSVSGKIFIVVGGLVGFIVGCIAWANNIPPFNHSVFITPKVLRLVGITAVVAWIGAGSHMLLNLTVRITTGTIKMLRGTTKKSSGQRNQDTHQGDTKRSKTQHPSESKIIVCSNCSQKLRVPIRNSRLLVKCKKCQHEFYH